MDYMDTMKHMVEHNKRCYWSSNPYLPHHKPPYSAQQVPTQKTEQLLVYIPPKEHKKQHNLVEPHKLATQPHYYDASSTVQRQRNTIPQLLMQDN